MSIAARGCRHQHPCWRDDRSVGDDGVIDGVPVTTELDGDLLDAASAAPDLLGRPPAGPIGQHRSRRGDRRLLGGPGPSPARHVAARPAVLAPHQPGPSPERRQVDRLDPVAVLDRRPATTTRTPRAPASRLDGTNNGPSSASTTPSTRTAGGPTSNSHMRVGSVSTGAPRL